MYGDKVNSLVQKKVAAKVEESLGLLALLKPLCKRAGRLTEAEQDVLFETVCNIGRVVNDATHEIWDARAKGFRDEGTSTAIRAV